MGGVLSLLVTFSIDLSSAIVISALSDVILFGLEKLLGKDFFKKKIKYNKMVVIVCKEYYPASLS